MSKEGFSRYNSADYLQTEEDIAAYLEAAAEVGGDDPAFMAWAEARAKALLQRLGTPGAVRSDDPLDVVGGATKNERIVLPADPADPEDRDVTAEAMDRGQRARLIRLTRTEMGLSQPEFAERFHVPLGTLRDWEQARATAPDFAIAYFRVIATYPDLVAKALE